MTEWEKNNHQNIILIKEKEKKQTKTMTQKLVCKEKNIWIRY